MSETALLVRDDSAQTIVFTETANTMKATALELSGIIGKVDSADSQQQAVLAQIELAKIFKLTEAARKAAKQPVLEFGQRIDDAAKKFVADVKDEQMRLSTLVGDYQQVLQQQARAAQQAEALRLKGIEDARLAELAKAQSHEEIDAIQEKHDIIAQQRPVQNLTPPKVEGQVVTNDIEFEVFDVAQLARAHWNLVTCEPRRGEIKTLLKNGVKLAGVRSWQVTKASVRVPTSPKPIDV